MAYVVNPPLRDDAIYSAVTKQQSTIEPRFLRAYLMDQRNTRHRKEVQDLLSKFYDTPIKLTSGRRPTISSSRGDDQGPRVAPHRGSADRLAAGQGARRREARPASPGAEQRQKKLQELLVGGSAIAGGWRRASWRNWPGSVRRSNRRRGRSSPKRRHRSGIS